MAEATTDRKSKLLVMLQQTPHDPFLLYGLALELKKEGDHLEAIKLLSRVIEIDAGYSYAYYQQGLSYEETGDLDAAKRTYRAGIQVSQDKGDTHAAGEIAAALELLE